MNILFVLENYYPHIGGVEIIFKNLCERLVKKGHDVTVLTHKFKDTQKNEIINGVNIVRVNCFENRYVFTFAAILQAIRLAKKADVIHTTTYNAAFPAWLAGIVAKKPKLITVHETWMGKWHEYSNFSKPLVIIHEFLEWLIYHIPRFDKYVCVSDSTKNMLVEKIPERKNNIVRIYNGFEDLSKRKISAAQKLKKELKNKFVIFSWGRPGVSKGFEYLIDAIPLIKKQVPNAFFVLMLSKDKQYEHKIEEFKKTIETSSSKNNLKNLSKDVLFLKPQKYEDIGAYREIANCIVVPSIAEGFGYVVLEASSSSAPVVATNTTSIPEVIHGKHLLVKPKSAQALAKGVLEVKKGKYKVSKKKVFPWEETVKEYEKTYYTLIKKIKKSERE